METLLVESGSARRDLDAVGVFAGVRRSVSVCVGVRRQKEHENLTSSNSKKKSC